MAFEAKCLVTLGQEFLINRPVRLVAADTAFADGLMFEDERTSLSGMTLETGVI